MERPLRLEPAGEELRVLQDVMELRLEQLGLQLGLQSVLRLVLGRLRELLLRLVLLFGAKLERTRVRGRRSVMVERSETG